MPTGVLWSPRVGFNWALSDDLREQLRGGFGLFAGRTPYVWLSNQYGNTGVEFRRLSTGFNTANRFTFVPDANAQPINVGGVASTEVDIIDPDYKYPSLMRGNLAYDRQLGFLGLVGTAEFLYSRNINDIKYQNLNLVPAGTVRPMAGRSIPETGLPASLI